MTKISLLIVNISIFLSTTIVSCSSEKDNVVSDSPEAGNLQLVINGEDFVRNGFVTKDSWKIEFEQVAVNVGNVTAYQTNPPFDPDREEQIQPQEAILVLDEAKTIDLTEGTEAIAVEQVSALPGSYNALTWELIPGDENTFEEQTIVMEGQATKEGQLINFTLGFAVPVTYRCGEYVGDERKGIVQPGESSEVEMTLHFDHIFGDLDTPPEDDLNQKALGFQPLANLAQEQELQADWQTLQQQLPPEDFQNLTQAIIGLGHVGEGHCKAEYKQ